MIFVNYSEWLFKFRSILKKPKKEILLLHRTFPDWHTKAGMPTHFGSALQAKNQKQKLHSIFFYNENWDQLEKRVNSGKSVLCICYLNLNKSEYSNTLILKTNKIKIQKGYLLSPLEDGAIVDQFPVTLKELAKNEALSVEDFISWYKPYEGAEFHIVHYTDFQYPVS